MKKLLLLPAFALLPAALDAQAPPPAPERPDRTIAVTGTGTVSRAPDQAIINVAVETSGATALAASQANATRMDALIAAIKRAGIADTNIRTSGYQIFPEYSNPRPGEAPRVSGYRVMNMVHITVDTVARVGRIIDAAVSTGANRIDGVSFLLRNSDAARQEALRIAIAKASAEAETIASTLGERLGPALSVNSSSFPVMPVPVPRPYMKMEAQVASAPTPIESGALDVQASVSIIFRLEGR